MRSAATSMRPRRAAARRRAFVASVGLASLVLAALVGVTAAPASASAHIGLTVIGGNKQVSAAWGAVPGATGYVVHWGAGRSTNRTVSTTATSVRLTAVKNLSTYAVRVTAVGASASSDRLSARPVPYVPTPIRSVKAVPDGANRIRVSWSGGDRARSVAVIAGADSMTESHHFSTGWMPAAVRSTVLTVPSSLRGVLGAGTGNAVFVKVVLSNSTARNPVKHLRFSLTDKYRLTASGTWSLAGSAPVGGASSRISVASWNVQSVTATASYSAKNRWAARLPRVVANIEDVHPDLIGVQELTTARIVPSCTNPAGSLRCTEQYQTLESALSKAAVPYRMARSDANAYLYSPSVSNAYVDSMLFYNPEKLQLVESGFLSPRTIMGSKWPSDHADELGMWARFAVLDAAGTPGRTFYAVSIHMPAGDYSRARSAEGAAIARWMDEKALQPDGTSLPVVVVGDFNANGARDGDAASLRLIADGYVDSAAVSDRTNLRFSTSNATNGTDGADEGYPVHAVIHPYPTSRIDYIMVKNSPYLVRYRNLVRTVGKRFDTRYNGSDHNMQLAVLGIGDPVPAP